MKVIGAGLPRTGTLSQKVALEMLGFGPCYHMVNVLTNLPLAEQWEDAMDGDADWDAIFGEHEATVDWPGSFFYRELADAYPEAKVVLSVRDPEAWEKSMRTTIWDTIYGQSAAAHISKARELVDPDWEHYIRLMAPDVGCPGHLQRPRDSARAAGRGHHPLPGAGPAQHPVGPAARLGRRRRLGAAVPLPRGRRAGQAVPSPERLEDVRRPEHDGSLMVLGEWRARNGEVQQLAGQPA